MDSWIVKRAQIDPGLAASAQAMHTGLEAFWTELRMVLRQNVEEFNALYIGQPDRLAEFSEDSMRATIRLKTEPHVHADVLRQDLRFVCSFSTGSRSLLAAESRIFGDWGTTRILSFVANGRGTGVSYTGDHILSAIEAAEFILSPVLFRA